MLTPLIHFDINYLFNKRLLSSFRHFVNFYKNKLRLGHKIMIYKSGEFFLKLIPIGNKPTQVYLIFIYGIAEIDEKWTEHPMSVTSWLGFNDVYLFLWNIRNI